MALSSFSGSNFVDDMDYDKKKCSHTVKFINGIFIYSFFYLLKENVNSYVKMCPKWPVNFCYKLFFHGSKP